MCGANLYSPTSASTAGDDPSARPGRGSARTACRPDGCCRNQARRSRTRLLRTPRLSHIWGRPVAGQRVPRSRSCVLPGQREVTTLSAQRPRCRMTWADARCRSGQGMRKSAKLDHTVPIQDHRRRRQNERDTTVYGGWKSRIANACPAIGMLPGIREACPSCGAVSGMREEGRDQRRVIQQIMGWRPHNLPIRPDRLREGINRCRGSSPRPPLCRHAPPRPRGRERAPRPPAALKRPRLRAARGHSCRLLLT